MYPQVYGLFTCRRNNGCDSNVLFCLVDGYNSEIRFNCQITIYKTCRLIIAMIGNSFKRNSKGATYNSLVEQL